MSDTELQLRQWQLTLERASAQKAVGKIIIERSKVGLKNRTKSY